MHPRGLGLAWRKVWPSTERKWWFRAAKINEKCGEVVATGIACNVGYKEDLENLVTETRDRVGPIEILVSNAGINPFYGPMSEISDAAFDKIMGSNVRSNHWLCQMVAPDMVKKGKGSMMITSSTGAFAGSENLGTYNISKLADIALVRNLAVEFGSKGAKSDDFYSKHTGPQNHQKSWFLQE